MIELDVDALSSAERYKVISAAVTPRPIAWVSTVNSKGAVNLAPFSSFTFVTYDPPAVAFSIGPGTEKLKDTLTNIRASGEFTVNAVTADIVREMAESSRRYPPEISEAADLGVALIPSRRVAPPRIARSPVAMECVVDRIVELNDRDAHRLVIGRVVLFHIAEEIWSGDRIDPFRYAPLGRIGGPLYVTRGEIMRVEPSKDDRFG